MSRGCLLLLLLSAGLAGCVRTAPPAVAAAATAEAPPPVSFEILDSRISVLLPVAVDADQRDRLLAHRRLVEGMRGKDPIAQKVVYDYLESVIAVEERAQPMSMGGDDAPPVVPIEEMKLTVDPVLPTGAATLTQARGSVSSGAYAEAIVALDTIAPTDPSFGEAQTLRREAVDAFARQERERAGEAFLKARDLPIGPERSLALQFVRATLVDINQRFPDNAYAEQIRENITRVDAELAGTSTKGTP